MFPRDQWYKLGLLLYMLVWFMGSFWMGGMIKSGAIVHWLGVELRAVEEYVYYALAGAIGGTLYAMRLFHAFYDQISDRWILWYLLRPIKCAGAAVMTIVLFQSGIMLLQTGTSMEAKIGIAFLVGFGYGKLMDKLKVLTETLFNGNNEKTSGDQPPK
ncbi:MULTISPECIES: hypothetical protein [Paenibacillus]|uniref:Uncharacterized protein n=1 Tax=Paenibacillus naphthalenovorans TaxID=162209 RepID=A0A0U2UQG0_9BACL|nr:MULTISPECIES: hypothetical protein [Paenibacillus]ALS25276.1 hypothetical protein IJ22_50140 [Paenibacillus naphthalenovorans]GCL73386.1 hypothetical protein PN4B1_33230 [Paenibacillus naphthalenovorans]SDI30475.1 hypothetical protein SAMN05421868_10531 [Paenibacillus naphthalenovorans]